MNIYEKLLKVQTHLKAPKNQWNDFSKFKYRSCEDILEAVKPLLKEVKATLIISDEVQLIGDRHYVVSTAKFTDIEEEKSISVTAYAREEQSKKGMDASQITGASSSYARKYALNGLFAIDDTKEADARNNETENTEPEKSEAEILEEQEKIKVQKIGQAKINTIRKKLGELKVSEKSVCQRYGIASVEEVTEELFIKIMNALVATEKAINKKK